MIIGAESNEEYVFWKVYLRIGIYLSDLVFTENSPFAFRNSPLHRRLG